MLGGEDQATRDRLNAAWTGHRSDAIAAAIRSAVPPLPHAMDYGCGPGHIGLRLVDHFDRLTLVDTSAPALAALEASTVVFPTVGVLSLDLTVDVAPEPVDCAFASMSLHHIPDIGAALAGLARTIRPGGWFVVAEYDADDGELHSAEPEFGGHHGFDRQALAGRIARQGFDRPVVGDAWAGRRWCGQTLVDYSVFLIAARRSVG